jgi:hypothetical protein
VRMLRECLGLPTEDQVRLTAARRVGEPSMRFATTRRRVSPAYASSTTKTFRAVRRLWVPTSSVVARPHAVAAEPPSAS